MWRSTRHQTTWIQICIFTFLGSLDVHSLEYYIRRGFDDNVYEQRDVFGYGNGSNCLLTPESFNSEKFDPQVHWPSNIKCTYRCGIYVSSDKGGAYTFLPEEKQCLSNTEVRTRLNECMWLFQYESAIMTSSLFVLDLNDSKSQALESTKLKTRCGIKGQHYYVGSGIWENIPQSSISFHIKKLPKMTVLGWKSQNATPYLGRIIKLELIHCKKKSWPNSAKECIVFKAKGIFHLQLETCLTCSTSQGTSTSYVKVSPSFASPNVTTTVLPLIPSTPERASVAMTSTSYINVSHISASPIVTAMASPLMSSTSEHISVVMTSVNTPASSAHTEGFTTPHPKRDSSGQESRNKDGIIIAVITTLVIVIVICLLVVIVWCKRRSYHKGRNSVKSGNLCADNPAYEKNKDHIIPLSSAQKKPNVNQDYDNFEYDYAAVDGVQLHASKKQPIYQSLDRGNENAPQIYQSLVNNPDLKNPDNADSKEYSYNHLQHPTYNPPHPKNTSDSLYSSLQKPGVDDDYLEPGTQITNSQPGASEAVYNVLEGPGDHSDPHVNDPVYNVLEDPDADPHPQDNDPVYNVLEDPDADPHPQDNDPVYNVLEDPDDDYDNAPSDDDQNLPASGQDNVAYSSTIDLKMPQTPSSPDYDVLEDPDGALPDSTYQPLGVRVQDDVYQPLDRTSQSIYQSLEPNDSTA